jgi:hypothetical protein
MDINRLVRRDILIYQDARTTRSWTTLAGARLMRRLVRAASLACFAALFNAGIPAGGAAQAEEGARIVGRVFDLESGRGLVGARVTVQGTSLATLTGADGRFVINDLPVAPVTVVAAYLGYAERVVVGVDFSGSSTALLEIGMVPGALAIQGIVVSAGGERGTVNRALEEQRAAVGLVNAITAEQIARSPDGDAAAAIQRVSGVTVQDGKFVFVRGLGERYTTTSLNGSRVPSPEPERKMVPLDLFPAGLLQTITTSKTFTPNLQGDFSGAQIDIRTREFPRDRQFSMSISQSFNSAATGRSLPMAPTVGGEWFAAATGPRRLPAIVQSTTTPTPGLQTNGMVNAMRNSWSATRKQGRPGVSTAASLGGSDDFFGRDLGYLISATYSLADEVNLDTRRENIEGDRYAGTVGRQSALIGGLFNLSTMLGDKARILLDNTYNRTADNEARVEEGFYENHGSNIRIERLRYVERTVRSNQLRGQHETGARGHLGWTLSSSGVSRQEPDRSEFVTWLDPAVPTWYNQEGAFRAYGGLTEESLEASANYRLELDDQGDRVLRFGALGRSTNRDAYDTGYAIRSREWSPTDTRWQLPPESFFDGRFADVDDELFELGIFNAGGGYTAADRLAAGYAMVEWALSPTLRFIGGARVERSTLEVQYEDVLGNRGTAAPSYTDVLPSLSLDLDVGETQKLRLSVSQTLARPEYREVAPICYRAGLGEEQRCGNPALVRTLIRNFDLRWEQYPAEGEALSLAFFAKHFVDPIEPRYQGRSGTNSLTYLNAESAVNYGIELEAMRNLGFLSRRLTPLLVFANATVMKSEVHTGIDGDPVRAMTGQAPYVVNAGLTWSPEHGSASATILYNVVGERIINARPSGNAVSDMIERPRPGLDLSLRFPLYATMSAKVDLKNLLDAPYEVRQDDLVRALHRSGRSAAIGVSWRP